MAEKPFNPYSLPLPAEISIMQQNGKWTFQTNAATSYYVYDKDEKGKSNCEDACASMWPPVYPNRSDAKPIGDWSLIPRKDGFKQWAYKGKPVYTYVHDIPGKPQGDGKDGVWHVLNP